MNALDVLQYGNLTFIKTVQAVPLVIRDEPGVCGGWSVKDIIAHLTSFEILLLEIFQNLLTRSPTPTLDQWLSNPEAFNERQVRQRHEWSSKQVLTEYLECSDEVMKFATRIPPDVWQQPGTLSWHGGQYCLDDFIVYEYYGHKREHSAEIAVYLRRVGESAQASG